MNYSFLISLYLTSVIDLLAFQYHIYNINLA